MESAPESKPFFSIIMPAYNRAKEIQRSLDSCLTQSFADFEIVVVDDGSEDETVAVVESIADPRVVLVRHDRNRGVCPARNTAVKHSRGEWIVLLDSDDELLPEVLADVYQRANTCPEDIGQLGLLSQRDTGKIMPEPVPAEMVLDYIGFIKWGDQVILSDFLQCIRRRTFEQVRFPDNRALEDAYLLDFSRFYKIYIIPILGVIKHTDSPNRLTTQWGQAYSDKLIRTAPDHLALMEYILASHGSALRQYGPRRFRVCRKSRVLYSFLSLRRSEGSLLAARYLVSYPWCIEVWMIWIAGLIGPRALATMKRWKYLLRN